MATIKYDEREPGKAVLTVHHDRDAAPRDTSVGAFHAAGQQVHSQVQARSTGQGPAEGDGATTNRTELLTSVGKPRAR
jgi:hypothetical protein